MCVCVCECVLEHNSIPLVLIACNFRDYITSRLRTRHAFKDFLSWPMIKFTFRAISQSLSELEQKKECSTQPWLVGGCALELVCMVNLTDQIGQG